MVRKGLVDLKGKGFQSLRLSRVYDKEQKTMEEEKRFYVNIGHVPFYDINNER